MTEPFQSLPVPTMAGLNLAQIVLYAQEQLHICHLWANIYICLNGNKASSYMKFTCPPPLLDDYLQF